MAKLTYNGKLLTYSGQLLVGGPSGPVQLSIAFVATQFVFNFKAPST